jgi:putative hydrolase of HD superfamily
MGAETTDQDEATARFIYEVGHLKRTPRTGWFYAGVAKAETESVAEHSFRTAIIAYVLATLEGVDPQRAATLALFHDTQETRTTDISYVGKQYLNRPDHEMITDHQTTGMPQLLRDGIRSLVADYEAQHSREAVLARDADKLECAVQAKEYAAQGQGETSDWVNSSLGELQSDTAKRLAETLVTMQPHAWWRALLDQP